MFLAKSVNTLATRCEGIPALLNKMKALGNALKWKNVQELCLFLGLLHCCGKFVKNLSSNLLPLNLLLYSNHPLEVDRRLHTSFQTNQEMAHLC